MGFRGIASADMVFDDVQVPVGNVVVSAGGGFRKLMEAFDLDALRQRDHEPGDCPGSARLRARLRAAAEAIRQADRRLPGRAVAARGHGDESEAARLLIYQAVWGASEGLPSIRQSSIAKCFANEMVREVTGHALQLMGAYGYSKAFPIEQRMRDAWGWGIAGGAIDIQKTNIASALIGRRFDQRR